MTAKCDFSASKSKRGLASLHARTFFMRVEKKRSRTSALNLAFVNVTNADGPGKMLHWHKTELHQQNKNVNLVCSSSHIEVYWLSIFNSIRSEAVRQLGLYFLWLSTVYGMRNTGFDLNEKILVIDHIITRHEIIEGLHSFMKSESCENLYCFVHP